jgi:hypothetical protein
LFLSPLLLVLFCWLLPVFPYFEAGCLLLLIVDRLSPASPASHLSFVHDMT